LSVGLSRRITPDSILDALPWTGLLWPDEKVTLLVQQDYKALGLDTSAVPEELALCLACASGYREAFNRINEQRHPPPSAPQSRSHRNPWYKDRCGVCKVRVGELHETNCELEQCPYCGRSRWAYACDDYELGLPDADRIPWSGVMIGAAECLEFGWYCRPVPGRGWVSCSPADPEASPDINRIYLLEECYWDRDKKRFFKKPSS
jgi:hypothetical protein